MKEVNRIFVQTKDGRTGQKITNEVINLEQPDPVNAMATVEVNFKRSDVNNNLDATSSSKIDGIKSKNLQKSMSQQNKFAVLGESMVEGLDLANQQGSQRTPNTPGSSQVKATEKGKEVETRMEPA
ncbi:hypothetical protein A2U01_0059339, partial [Trifolium medium]|nr:hypothetical protein [Trifolium medium]